MRPDTSAVQIYAHCIAKEMGGRPDPWRIKGHLGHLIPAAFVLKTSLDKKDEEGLRAGCPRIVSVLLNARAIKTHLLRIKMTKPEGISHHALTENELAYILYRKEDFVVERGHYSWRFNSKKGVREEEIRNKIYSIATSVGDAVENVLILYISKAMYCDRLWNSPVVKKAASDPWLSLIPDLIRSYGSFKQTLPICMGINSEFDKLIEAILKIQQKPE